MFRHLIGEYNMSTKAQALKKAKQLGLKGVHKMPSGEWMAGGTHKAYTSAVKKTKTKTKSKVAKKSRKAPARKKRGY
jgi:hypothetical protein